jgi:hypothetical protein
MLFTRKTSRVAIEQFGLFEVVVSLLTGYPRWAALSIALGSAAARALRVPNPAWVKRSA